MVFCTSDPETQILFFFGGRTFCPWEILALERSHVRQGAGAAANTLVCFVVREGGAPHQIHLCTLLSGKVGGAPHQIHVYASLSGRAGGAAANTLMHFVVRWGARTWERSRAKISHGKKVRPKKKKKNLGFWVKSAKNHYKIKGFGA